MIRNAVTGDTPGPCDICGTVNHRHLADLCFNGDSAVYPLWRCRKCGVVMHWPRPSDDAVRDRYDASYYVFSERPQQRWMRAAQLYLTHLAGLKTQAPGRRLLEVGCATGELLALARRCGWNVQGVELSDAAARTARERYRLAVQAGTLEAQNGRLGTFDVVIATDVLEHVVSPTAFVRAIRDRLRPGGLAVIETPNWGGWWRRFGGQRWLGYNRFHIFLFDKTALAYLMDTCGFASCRFATSTHVGHRLWGDRPEWAGVLDRLPAGARWRCRRWLNHVSSRRSGEAFSCEPPASLDDAFQWVERAGESPFTRRGFLNNDNLAVIARRP